MMAEELKGLIDIVADLPGTALWVLLGFGVYKIVGYLSVTGAITYISKLAITNIWREKKLEPKEFTLNGICLYEKTEAELKLQLYRLVGKTHSHCKDRILDTDIAWLRSAIDEKETREREESEPK